MVFPVIPIELWLMFLAISEEFEADIIVVPNLAFCLSKNNGSYYVNNTYLALFGMVKFLATFPANCLCMALV